jgi:hypothetical protein
MQQNDDNRDLTNKSDASNEEKEEKIEDMEDWQNEHGNPSNEFLQALAEAGNKRKLREIAEDLDAEFSPGASAEELIGAIRSATRDDPNTTT